MHAVGYPHDCWQFQCQKIVALREANERDRTAAHTHLIDGFEHLCLVVHA